MILEKVYDELYGMIEDLKKKIQAAEKSDVTITPALESGTKVADFEIDGTEGSIYAPAPAEWMLEAEYTGEEGITGCTTDSYIRVYSILDRQLFRADFQLTLSTNLAANSATSALATLPAALAPDQVTGGTLGNVIGGKYYPGFCYVDTAGQVHLVNTAATTTVFYANGSFFWAKTKATGRTKTTKKK